MRTPPTTLVELIDHGAANWPDLPMLLARQGDTATYGEYRRRVEEMAAGFADLGIGEGDVVSWILPTWVDTVVLAGALARVGAVQNPIITIYRDREVGFCCRQANTTLLITPGVFGGFDFGAMAERIAAAQPGLRTLVFTPGNVPTGDASSLPALAPPAPNTVRWLT